jgi:hypothetical protein
MRFMVLGTVTVQTAALCDVIPYKGKAILLQALRVPEV